MQNQTSLVISSCAIIISVIALYINWKTYKIKQREYELAKEKSDREKDDHLNKKTTPDIITPASGENLDEWVADEWKNTNAGRTIPGVTIISKKRRVNLWLPAIGLLIGTGSFVIQLHELSSIRKEQEIARKELLAEQDKFIAMLKEYSFHPSPNPLNSKEQRLIYELHISEDTLAAARKQMSDLDSRRELFVKESTTERYREIKENLMARAEALQTAAQEGKRD